MTLSREGRPSGEAYVELETPEDFKKALELHKKNMGTRYIEVFTSKRAEMEWMLGSQGRRGSFNPGVDEGIDDEFGYVRLRGLPFGSKAEDVDQFFTG